MKKAVLIPTCHALRQLHLVVEPKPLRGKGCGADLIARRRAAPRP